MSTLKPFVKDPKFISSRSRTAPPYLMEPITSRVRKAGRQIHQGCLEGAARVKVIVLHGPSTSDGQTNPINHIVN